MRTPLLAPSLLLIAAALPAADGATAPATVLVVGATRLADPAFEQPYALHTLDREAIDERNARSLTDALDRTPGVVVQKTAGNQASPFIRGLTGQQSLILFDGVRLNNALWRSGPNQYAALIPEESVDRVDVILGSGTTVMGSDGLTGAMDFRLAEAGRGETRAAAPAVGGRYETASGGTGWASLDGRAGGMAYSLDGSWSAFSDLEGGKDSGDRLTPEREDDTIPNSGYDQYSLGARLAWLGWEGQRFEASAGRVEQSDAPRPDGYAENSGVATRISRGYDLQRFDYLHLRHAVVDAGPWSQVQTTLWYHGNREEEIREQLSNPTTYRREEWDNEVSTLGGDLQFQHQVRSHAITYGTTIYRDAVDAEYRRFQGPAANPAAAVRVQQAQDADRTTVPDGSEYLGIAVFAQDRWDMTERWSLLLGLRYDRVAWELPVSATRLPGFPEGTIEEDAEALTGSARLAWLVTDGFLGFAGVGQGFRAPTWSDLIGTQSRASSPIVPVANPDLDPERSLTVEAGFKAEGHGNSLSLSVFHTAIDDQITVLYRDTNGDGTADSAERVNASESWLHGGELAFDLGIPVPLPDGWRLGAFSTTSLVRGEEDVEQPDGSVAEVPISRANTLTGVAGLRIEDSVHWYALVQTRWADAYDDPNPADANDVRHTTAGDPDGSMPGWAVVDVKGGWHTADRRLRIDGGIENLGDKTYRQVGSGTDGAGLNLVVGARLRF
jgi:hemoglobin/transferrin/lactoferrin receptor protein